MNTPKWNRFKVVINILFTVLAVILADTFTELFFGGRFIAEIATLIVILIIFEVIQQFILSVIEHSDFLSRYFK